MTRYCKWTIKLCYLFIIKVCKKFCAKQINMIIVNSNCFFCFPWVWPFRTHEVCTDYEVLDCPAAGSALSAATVECSALASTQFLFVDCLLLCACFQTSWTGLIRWRYRCTAVIRHPAKRHGPFRQGAHAGVWQNGLPCVPVRQPEVWRPQMPRFQSVPEDAGHHSTRYHSCGREIVVCTESNWMTTDSKFRRALLLRLKVLLSVKFYSTVILKWSTFLSLGSQSSSHWRDHSKDGWQTTSYRHIPKWPILLLFPSHHAGL